MSERVERDIKELEKDNEKAEKSIETLEQGINTNLVAINGLKHLLELKEKESDLGKRDIEFDKIIEQKDAEIKKYQEQLIAEKENKKELGDKKDEEITILRKKLKDLQQVQKIKVKAPPKEKPQNPIYKTTIEKIHIPDTKIKETEANKATMEIMEDKK